MVPKNTRICIVIIILASLINLSAGLDARPADNVSDPPHLENMENLPSGPGWTEIYGEISAISATHVSIETGTNVYNLPMALGVRIYCNGMPSIWWALRPVTSSAFFEAKAFINKKEQVTFIAGLYCGEICILKGWRRERENLFLKLTGADSGQTFWRMVETNAKIPQFNWFDEDIELYVLYNYKKNIRAVFLPD